VKMDFLKSRISQERVRKKIERKNREKPRNARIRGESSNLGVLNHDQRGGKGGWVGKKNPS